MMRRSLLFWMGPWLAIGLGACATSRPPVLPVLDVSKACAEWRWIGISKVENHCPEIPGWEARPLFSRRALVDAEENADCTEEARSRGACSPGLLKLIQELNRFCVYEPPRFARALPPPVSAGLVRVDQDCAALSLSGETQAVARQRELYSSRLRKQAGARAFAVGNPDSVRLAFLDTEPTGTEVSERRGRSPHGYTLARMARDMVCDEGRCAAHVTTRLALPMISFDPRNRAASRIDDDCGGPGGRSQRECGGYMGFQSDLARAIEAEVEAWRRARNEGGERHLVLNLSLAWDGNLFGGLDERSVAEMRAGTQAVYKALQYANALDVLVLAAAGNRKGKPCENVGPLLPAAWEIGTPREETCGKPRQTPLVYAVGGVRSDGKPLINARDGGMPRRVAYGENAMVPPYLTEPPSILTGSSVSTAVVSSVAAAVWSSFPGRSSKEVMDLLDGSGEELFNADFWFGSTPGAQGPAAHRLSLCTALQAAWDQWGPSSGKVELGCAKWTGIQSLGDPHPWFPDSCDPWVHSQPPTPPCLSCGDAGLPPPPQN